MVSIPAAFSLLMLTLIMFAQEHSNWCAAGHIWPLAAI
jgi:hypothetical protein